MLKNFVTACVCGGERGGGGMSECKLAAPNDVSNVHQSIVRFYHSIWHVAQSSCGYILSVAIILSVCLCNIFIAVT